jgi:archaellum component FlaC
MTSADSKADIDWFSQREYIMFKHELASQRKINNFILKECKENKRLLDLKCDDLTKTVNNIQTSVIFVSTLSGFLQATKLQFGIPSDYIEVISITISTYIALILSISKYYKLDELKEQIQNLREKYSLLHNKIEHRMDVLGPWNNRHLWEYKNATDKLAEWREVLADMHEQYKNIIETKQSLTTEFEIIMDTISRNKYNSINAYLNFNNRTELFTVQTKEADLENTIVSKQVHFPKHAHPTIILQHEALDNWDDEESVV